MPNILRTHFICFYVTDSLLTRTNLCEKFLNSCTTDTGNFKYTSNSEPYPDILYCCQCIICLPPYVSEHFTISRARTTRSPFIRSHITQTISERLHVLYCLVQETLLKIRRRLVICRAGKALQTQSESGINKYIHACVCL